MLWYVCEHYVIRNKIDIYGPTGVWIEFAIFMYFHLTSLEKIILWINKGRNFINKEKIDIKKKRKEHALKERRWYQTAEHSV